jgi:hypothetical protein
VIGFFNCQPKELIMEIIRKFIANIRRKLFAARTEREIYFKIFPHLNHRADHGYPFSSSDELEKSHLKCFYNVSKTLEEINRAAIKMPKAEGDAFRYIVARDLNEQVTMYLEFARSRECNCEYEPQPVATAA